MIFLKTQKFLRLFRYKKAYYFRLPKSGGKCACVLIEKMNIGQSALSYHMKILCDSGIVNARQEGKWTHYSLSKSGSEYASKRLLELINTKY